MKLHKQTIIISSTNTINLKKILSNLKEAGKGIFLALSTLKTRYGEYFIKFVLGILDYDKISKEARVALAEPVNNIAKMSAENVPMHNLPKAAM